MKVKIISHVIRQNNIQIFFKIIFFKYRTRQLKTIETNKKVTYFDWNASLTKNDV